MRRSVFVLIPSLLLVAAPLGAQTNQAVADQVMALARAQWAAEIARRPVAEIMKDAADEYTEFNSDYPTRLDGKALNAKLAEAYMSGSGQFIAADMVNPKVQVYGDVAILSYNFIGATMDSDGAVEAVKAKSTRIYAKKDGQWMLVHANFAPVDD